MTDRQRLSLQMDNGFAKLFGIQSRRGKTRGGVLEHGGRLVQAAHDIYTHALRRDAEDNLRNTRKRLSK